MLKHNNSYVFIDAANIFYGGVKSLHWKIDFAKLFQYLKNQYNATKVFYYSGIDTGSYVPESSDTIDLDELIKSLESFKKDDSTKPEDITDNENFLSRAKFYQELQTLGYELRLKPVKTFTDGEKKVKKANCDVDLTFDLMRFMSQYTTAVILSGDGDFFPILNYLKKKHKKIKVLARAERTAKEIRKLAADELIDFGSLKLELRSDKKNPRVSGD